MKTDKKNVKVNSLLPKALVLNSNLNKWQSGSKALYPLKEKYTNISIETSITVASMGLQYQSTLS